MIRYMNILAFTIVGMLMLTGCEDKKVDYNINNFGGDVITEYGENGGEINESKATEIEATTEKNFDQNVLVQKLGIPESVNVELSTEGTLLKKITVETEHVSVPDKDKMYTKEYTLMAFSDEDKENVLRAIFDEDTGVHNSPGESALTEQYVDIILKNKDDILDMSADDFIGKIDGEIFLVHFISPEWSVNSGIQISRVFDEEIPEELQSLQAEHITYGVFGDGGEALMSEEEKKAMEGLDKVENKCGMTVKDAELKSLEYFDRWNLWDVKEISARETYREYRDAGYNMIQTEMYGYRIDFVAAINGEAVYQPKANNIDTLRAKKMDESSIDQYYNSELSTYGININDNGIVSFSCMWPMKTKDELHEVDNLISWDEAMENLKAIIPVHFEGYEGYSEVRFDDVRLTYFRTKTGDGTYEVIPVYVFAQSLDYVELDDAQSVTKQTEPVQLIMIDARTGEEVDIVQDESRIGLKSKQGLNTDEEVE
ncbi:MAG: hypothetical protein J6A82_01285 [Coprococcus sp.]|nr:hypothetical protein [Coprococcus sp.]